MRRIGVFVCHCGTNIAATVDVKTVAETLGKEPAVVFATDYPYMCSEAGQNIIKDAIKEYQLEGVVVCSCSPRMHEATFRKTVSAAGLNPYMLEVANIREQCSWIHKDIEEATAKAIVLGRAAIAKGFAEYTADRRRKPGNQACFGYRRRYRRYPDRSGYRRGWLSGRYRRKRTHHRR